MKPKQALDIDALVSEAVPPHPEPQVLFVMPVRVVSEANEREHWRTRHNRKKAQQEELRKWWQAANAYVLSSVSLPCTVRLLRIGPKRLDSDNLAGSFKHVQDAIAREIGVDDGDERVKWEYEQCAVGKRVYQVRVEVY